MTTKTQGVYSLTSGAKWHAYQVFTLGMNTSVLFLIKSLDKNYKNRNMLCCGYIEHTGYKPFRIDKIRQNSPFLVVKTFFNTIVAVVEAPRRFTGGITARKEMRYG